MGMRVVQPVHQLLQEPPRQGLLQPAAPRVQPLAQVAAVGVLQRQVQPHVSGDANLCTRASDRTVVETQFKTQCQARLVRLCAQCWQRHCDAASAGPAPPLSL